MSGCSREAVTLANARTQGWSLKVILWTVVAHLVLAGLALIVAAKSKRTAEGYRIGLSPAAWVLGSSFSYLVDARLVKATQLDGLYYSASSGISGGFFIGRDRG